MITGQAAPPDPSWFYSSLAQSSAAIVGFVGAFLIFRIQDYVASWTRNKEDLEALQRTWTRANDDVETGYKQWKKADANASPHISPGPNIDRFVDPSRRRERDDAWARLRPLLDKRVEERFPRELYTLTFFIGALFLVGTLAPLLWLDAPSGEEQGVWLGLVSMLIVTVCAFMLRQSRSALSRFRGARLYQSVEMEYDERIGWEMGMEAEDEERRAERQAKKVKAEWEAAEKAAGEEREAEARAKAEQAKVKAEARAERAKAKAVKAARRRQ